MGIRKWHKVARGRKEWRRTEWGSQGPQWTVALEEEEEEEEEEEKEQEQEEKEEEEEKKKKKNSMQQCPNQECSCPLLETSLRSRSPIYVLRPHF
jgi:hypothetical protein